ncbi:MAG: 2-isopropylmalate synthase [Catenulispora sp.]
MSDFDVPTDARRRLRTPTGPAPAEQPWWNTQRGSSMPFGRYGRSASRTPAPPVGRRWPDRVIERAPLWVPVDLRDGNQSLPHPMDSRRKAAFFELLVAMGFKEIEVGYPASGDTDFAFIRRLVAEGVPDDVTVSVFTPARPELVDRTFEAIQGIDRAVVHLCLATACLWRETVFGLTATELKDYTVAAAERIAKLADAMPASQLRFEFSPETFNVTEPEFALEVCAAVTQVWDAAPDRPVTLNLPSTVETDTPDVYADQIEWMHLNLDRRESVILSVHPHNDRGTAVASAELALKAGADRVEGTLFGNGERTGNACLGTLALNLFSHGVDPQLDFSDIDAVREVVEFGNQMPVHDRHPYVGDLVYTAFSGTHQDAIAKGLTALADRAAARGVPVRDLDWEVPYLPIDPADVGRSYESVVRVNSQSGKGGVAHVLKQVHGVDLPRPLRIELGRAVQRVGDAEGAEIDAGRLWRIFAEEYLEPGKALRLEGLEALEALESLEGSAAGGAVRARLAVAGTAAAAVGEGADAVAAVLDALARAGHVVQVRSLTQQDRAVADDRGRFAGYAEVVLADAVACGAAVADAADSAKARAIVSAVDRALR